MDGDADTATATATAIPSRRPFHRDSFHDVRKKHYNNKENASYQGSNDIKALKERQIEWARPGTVLNRNINRGGYSRNSLPGVTRKFRIVKDNRTKQKVDGETVPELFHNGNSSNGHSVSKFGDKSSTEKLDAQHHLVTQGSIGVIQADNGCETQAHNKEAKPSSGQGPEQSEGMRTTSVGSHAVLEKGNQNKSLTVPSGTKNFTGELCCSSSDPIHVPSGSKSAGTYGAIKREVGVVGARHRPSDGAATYTSTSNSLVTVTTATRDKCSTEQQSRLPGASSKSSRSSSSMSLSSRSFPSSQHHSKPSINAGHSKVRTHLEWKPKSISPGSVNDAVTVASSGATSVNANQAGLADLSKKLSRANVSEDEHVIIPEHLRVPDSEKTHLIFGTFESELASKSLTSVSDTASKEGLNIHSSTSSTALNSVRSTDNVSPSDQMDLVGSCGTVPQTDTVVSVSEHHHSLTEDIEVRSPGVIGEYRSNEMISSKVTHSLPQSQHQGNPAVQNFKAYEPDSGYDMPFVTKAADGETAHTAYSSEIMGLHPADVNQLSVSAMTQQPVPQMYQQIQVPQFPNFLPYRHVLSPYYVPPVAVPNYSSNPAFPQLPHASSYLVMPNGTPQLATNGVKYGPPHQYKQVFTGNPAGYGGYSNQNGYPVSAGMIDSVGNVEDAGLSKYGDINIYAPNPQAETSDVWIQAQRDIPSMPSTPFYNLMGQPVSPHTTFLPAQNGHSPFGPAPHSAHLQYPGMPHTLQPTSMTMVQNPQSMVHQPAVPPLAGNIGIDMAAMAPGAQVGAFQQNQLAHLGWAPNF